jgi:putative phosphoribosyl transferase
MFRDRTDAGRRLAERLMGYPLPRPLILALPRGGVPVAVEVATALDADMDVLVVRKLGVPGNPEFAMGAAGEDGVLIVDHPLRRQLHITSEQVDAIAAEQQREIERRVRLYRGGRSKLGVAGRNVIIVDDGLATGSTAAAAVDVVRHLGATHVTLAVPVASVQSLEWLRPMVDDLVCLEVPDPFYAVGQHFRVFDQVSDHEVMRILEEHPRRDPVDGSGRLVVDEEIVIESGHLRLDGHLTIPPKARGVVLFAHGSGSGRFSPRNTAVAGVLNSAGLGTLLFDLLTDSEADNRRNVFDIELLAARLVNATAWLRERADVGTLPIGYFGASTGAAAALVAAALKPDDVSAVVSRGGRPDLAGDWLPKVQAPTLLIVGGHDYQVIELNREAQAHLRCTNLLEIVPGATHLFEEPGTLAQAARLAQTWFVQYLQ